MSALMGNLLDGLSHADVVNLLEKRPLRGTLSYTGIPINGTCNWERQISGEQKRLSVTGRRHHRPAGVLADVNYELKARNYYFYSEIL